MADGIEKGEKMKEEKRFYILNAASWGILFLFSIEPLSEIVTEPWQLWLVLAIEAIVLYLIWESLVLLEFRNGKSKEGRSRNGKSKNG